MNKELIEEIDQIPMLPESILKVEKVYADEESSIKDMTDALSSDPVIIANILKIANSPLYGFSAEIKDIARAASLYGKDTIRSFALNIAANECVPIDVTPYEITSGGYIKKAQTQNALITNWVSKVDRSLLANLAPASFLIEIGKIMISRYLVNHQLEGKFKELCSNTDSTIEGNEKEVCGCNSYDVAATIFHHWNFDPELVHLVRYANTPDDALDEETKTLARYLHVAKTAVDFTGNLSKEGLEEAYDLIEEYELDRNKFDMAVEKIEEAA
ncbi:HDOD domain-containing protein [Sulfurimonas sp. SAG-AH-194-I05]|nr:HDOD domain-containing protein [Sulfurimonas sp. SAG-AH-194-I05]MDF1875283.1 HDOD domain-containing protein [Sulfurimonas sp. SAG-AH-194-I05]